MIILILTSILSVLLAQFYWIISVLHSRSCPTCYNVFAFLTYPLPLTIGHNSFSITHLSFWFGIYGQELGARMMYSFLTGVARATTLSNQAAVAYSEWVENSLLTVERTAVNWGWDSLYRGHIAERPRLLI